MAAEESVNVRSPGRFSCAASWALDRALYGRSKCYPDGEPLMDWKTLRGREWVPCNCDHDDCRGYCMQAQGQGCRCGSTSTENPPPVDIDKGRKVQHKQRQSVVPDVGRVSF